MPSSAPHIHDAATISDLTFAAPLRSDTAARVELPAGLKDESGRVLANAARFGPPGGVVAISAQEVDGQVVVRLREIQGADPASAEAQVAQVRQSVQQAIAGDLLTQRSSLLHGGRLRERQSGTPEALLDAVLVQQLSQRQPEEVGVLAVGHGRSWSRASSSLSRASWW